MWLLCPAEVTPLPTPCVTATAEPCWGWAEPHNLLQSSWWLFEPCCICQSVVGALQNPNKSLSAPTPPLHLEHARAVQLRQCWSPGAGHICRVRAGPGGPGSCQSVTELIISMVNLGKAICPPAPAAPGHPCDYPQPQRWVPLKRPFPEPLTWSF